MSKGKGESAVGTFAKIFLSKRDAESGFDKHIVDTKYDTDYDLQQLVMARRELDKNEDRRNARATAKMNSKARSNANRNDNIETLTKVRELLEFNTDYKAPAPLASDAKAASVAGLIQAQRNQITKMLDSYRGSISEARREYEVREAMERGRSAPSRPHSPEPFSRLGSLADFTVQNRSEEITQEEQSESLAMSQRTPMIPGSVTASTASMRGQAGKSFGAPTARGYLDDYSWADVDRSITDYNQATMNDAAVMAAARHPGSTLGPTNPVVGRSPLFDNIFLTTDQLRELTERADATRTVAKRISTDFQDGPPTPEQRTWMGRRKWKTAPKAKVQKLVVTVQERPKHAPDPRWLTRAPSVSPADRNNDMRLITRW